MKKSTNRRGLNRAGNKLCANCCTADKQEKINKKIAPTARRLPNPSFVHLKGKAADVQVRALQQPVLLQDAAQISDRRCVLLVDHLFRTAAEGSAR